MLQGLRTQRSRKSFVCRLSSVSFPSSKDNLDRVLTKIVHCSMLAEDAIKSAISNYYTKNPKARATDLGGKSAPLPKVEVETISAAA
jgi:hypothetical protein